MPRRTARFAACAFVLSLFVLGCAAGPTAKRETQGETGGSPLLGGNGSPQLSVIFSAGRHLELETCGCAIANLGGMDREHNLTREWKLGQSQPFLFVSGGDVLSGDGMATPKRQAFRSKKADFVMEGMKLLGVDILSPSVSDMAWGIDRIRAWEKASGMEWVSANIYDTKTGQPVFKPYVERTYKGFTLPVLVVGLSHPTAEGEIVKGFEAKDPIKSLEKVLKALPPAKRLIVLVSSLSPEKQEEVRKRFPEVAVIFDGSDKAGNEIEQLDEHTVTTRLLGRGRALARLDLWVKGDKPVVFNGELARGYSLARDQWMASISEIDKRLKTTKKKKDKQSLLSEKSRLQAELERHRFYTFEHFEDGVVYDYKLASVDSSHEKPRNPLTDLFDRYHEAVRGLALDDE